MVRRRVAVGVVVGVLGLLVGVAPSSSLTAADAPALWGSGDRPADFVEYTFPEGLPGNQDGPANSFADLSATPGPLDADGCGALPVGPSPAESLPTIGPDHDPDTMPTTSASFVIDAAKICDGPGGPLTLLVVSGPMNAPNEGGTIRLVFARPAADQPFGRVAIEYRAGACFTIGASAGFPGDGTDAPVYLLQAWNFADDPMVACSSRAVAQETTTTTEQPVSTTTTEVADGGDTTTSTTLAPAAPAPATGAQAVSGAPDYAG